MSLLRDSSVQDEFGEGFKIIKESDYRSKQNHSELAG
jgi:hypothetical protein